MPNAKVCTSFVPYTATATSAQTDRPASNVALLTKPYRTWRSTSAGTERLTLDLTASPPSVAGLLLRNANFSTITIETSPDNAAWTTRYNAVSVPLWTAARRRNVWLDAAGPLTVRYWRLTPASPVGGAGFFELGAVALLASITTLGRNVSAWRPTYREGVTVTPLASGADVNSESPCWVEYALPWETGSDGLADVEALVALGRAAPIALYENRGDASRAILGVRMDDVEVAEAFRAFGVTLGIRESI